jgi:hypothetical protein
MESERRSPPDPFRSDCAARSVHRGGLSVAGVTRPPRSEVGWTGDQNEVGGCGWSGSGNGGTGSGLGVVGSNGSISSGGGIAGGGSRGSGASGSDVVMTGRYPPAVRLNHAASECPDQPVVGSGKCCSVPRAGLVPQRCRPEPVRHANEGSLATPRGPGFFAVGWSAGGAHWLVLRTSSYPGSPCAVLGVSQGERCTAPGRVR